MRLQSLHDSAGREEPDADPEADGHGQRQECRKTTRLEKKRDIGRHQRDAQLGGHEQRPDRRYRADRL
jgi:hypothetical protein